VRSRAVIITADDLGLWPEVNEAVMAGYDAGIISTAALRVTARASYPAMLSAGMRPNLGVGLHLVLCDGQSALPHRHIPNLVDRSGNFVRRPMEAAWMYRRGGKLGDELRLEIRAQIEKFLSSGLFLGFISSHYGLHLQPAILSIIKELARDYPISAIRKPAGPMWRANQSIRRPAWERRVERGLIAPVLRWGRMRSGAFLGPDRVELLCPQRPVTEHAAAQRLTGAPRGLTEFVCHPSSLAARYDGPGELAVVTSATVRAAIAEADVEVISYRDLAEGAWSRRAPAIEPPATAVPER